MPVYVLDEAAEIHVEREAERTIEGLRALVADAPDDLLGLAAEVELLTDDADAVAAALRVARQANNSGGVFISLPGQNGQKPSLVEGGF